MKQPKRISLLQAETTLINFINDCDVDDLCAIIDHAFGVHSYMDPGTDEIVISPDPELYGDAFGKFDEENPDEGEEDEV